MKKKVLSLALTLALCLGLTIPAFAAPVNISEEGVDVVFNNVISYEDVPLWYPDDGDGEPCAIVKRIYHLASDRDAIVVQNTYEDPDNTAEVYLSYMTSAVVDGYEIDGKPVLCPLMNNLEVADEEDISFGYINLRDNLGKKSDEDRSLKEGESSGAIIPSFPAEIGTLVCLNFSLDIQSTTPGVSAGGSHVALSVYCAFDDGKFSFSDNTLKPSTGPTEPEPTTPAAEAATASPTNDSLTADGVLQAPTVYKINDSNYFKIRDLAAILNGTDKQFSVGYDSALQSVTATTGQGYEKTATDLAGAPAGGTKTAQPSNDAIYINGKKVAAEVYKIDGNNYFKLRDLGKALDFYVGWSADRGMYIETNKNYTE